MKASTEFLLLARGEAMDDLDQEIRELEAQKALIDRELESLYLIKDAQDKRDTEECALDRAVQ